MTLHIILYDLYTTSLIFILN